VGNKLKCREDPIGQQILTKTYKCDGQLKGRSRSCLPCSTGPWKAIRELQGMICTRRRHQNIWNTGQVNQKI